MSRAVSSVMASHWSLPPSLEVDGKQLYAWCALDTLMFPALIGRTVHIASPCHGTGKSVRLTVEPDRVVSVEPSTAVVSIVTPDEMASVRSAFCNNVHFSVHRVQPKTGLTNTLNRAFCPLKMPLNWVAIWERVMRSQDLLMGPVVTFNLRQLRLRQSWPYNDVL